MRLDIVSQDRLGITHEILAIIASLKLNLAAIEMHQYHTFIFVDEPKFDKQQACEALLGLDGVTSITEIDLLPSERKRKHLEALMAKLPDPMVDINDMGDILIANDAAEQTFGYGKNQLEGVNIVTLTGCRLSDILSPMPAPLEVSIGLKSFLMDITAVITGNKTTGAVIVFRSPQRLGEQIAAIQPQKGENIETIVGDCQQMKVIGQQTRRFALLDLPVLIKGETGTGKELLARALHECGPRAKAPFLAINCATLAENLLESELFGYAAGAFSGASRGGKPGLFELADNGTVLLDEIGEMSIYLQAKLLRFLQDYSFRRIGGTNELKVNVRIVCATHRDLAQMTKDGSFREDLFYRLNILNLHLPPLRERRDDIPALVDFFALKAAEQINHICPEFTASAILQLKQYHWPGNIRQLQNVIFRTLAMCDKSLIDSEDIQFTDEQQPVATTDFDYNKVACLSSAVEDFEKQLFKALLVDFPSTRKLAQRLGVSHAKVSRKLNKYGISSPNAHQK